MNTIKRNQLYTNYMATLDTNITALAAGNNVTMTDDGDGNYTVEGGGILVQKDWTNYDTVYKNEGTWRDLFLVGVMGTVTAEEDWLILNGGAIGSDAGIHSTKQALNPLFSLYLEWSNQNAGYSNSHCFPVMSFETAANGIHGFALIQSRTTAGGYGMQLLSNGALVYEVVGTDFNKDGFNTINITYDGEWLSCGINEAPSPVSQISTANAALPRALKFSNFVFDETLIPATTINGVGTTLHKNLLVTGL